MVEMKMFNMASFSRWSRMGLLSFLLVGVCLSLPFILETAHAKAPAVENPDSSGSSVSPDEEYIGNVLADMVAPER